MVSRGKKARVPVPDQILWIPGRLPGLNELLEAKGSKVREARHRAKNDAQAKIALFARSQLKPVKRATFHYEFHEPNRKRDPSNIAAGAIKIIEDALQLAGIIDNDGWKAVAGFTVAFVVDRESQGVWLKLEACSG